MTSQVTVRRRSTRTSPGATAPVSPGEALESAANPERTVRSTPGRAVQIYRMTLRTRGVAPQGGTVAASTRGSHAAHPVQHPPLLARPRRPRDLELETINCAALEEASPSALAVTYWFRPDSPQAACPVTLELNGRLLEAASHDAEAGTGRERFQETAVFSALPIHDGWAALTTRIEEVTPGRWSITARRVEETEASTAIGPAVFAPWAAQKAPGVRVGAWPTMVLLGFVVGLVLQASLARWMGLDGPLTWITAGASLLGLVGAKIYFLVTHPGTRRLSATGMCLQGFVIVTLGTLVGGLLLTGVPLGPALDASAPGLLAGMAVGRVGCFLGGCCTGRPTASRWGIWSTDRRVGVRRIPVQLLEAGWTALTAALALITAVSSPDLGQGLIFLIFVSVQLLGRQFLLPLRAETRRTRYLRPLVVLISALTAVAGIAALI